MQALVVDCRDRGIKVFAASVTRTPEDPNQLVIRHALGLGFITEILGKEAFHVEMPVILMGSYQAQSSAGHASALHTGQRNRVLVVGGLGSPFGKGGLKVLARPISGILIPGPVSIKKLAGAGNSNCASADAAWAGAQMLARLRPEDAFVVEGQSDYTNVIQLSPTSESSVAEFPVEHREAMFSRENIVKRMLFSSAFRTLRGFDEGGVLVKPSEEEVKELVLTMGRQHLTATEWSEREYLGKGFMALGYAYSSIIRKVIEDLLAAEAEQEPSSAEIVEATTKE